MKLLKKTITFKDKINRRKKEGEGRFSFTFSRREISPATLMQQSCYIKLVTLR